MGSQKLQRTNKACDRHWNQVLLPILKTHLKGLPLSAEWKKDFMLYVIKHKIRHPKELDLGLIVDQVCPGQTSQSVSSYARGAVSDYKKKGNTAENHKDLPLDE